MKVMQELQDGPRWIVLDDAKGGTGKALISLAV